MGEAEGRNPAGADHREDDRGRRRFGPASGSIPTRSSRRASISGWATIAYRVRASFLPGPQALVADRLKKVKLHEFSLAGGAVLETGCVYIVPLMEQPQAAARCQRRRQSEIVHRPARYLHPHHHRPCARVRHHPRRLCTGRSISRSARAPFPSWCVPARACRRCASAPATRGSTTRRSCALHREGQLVDGTPHVDNGLTLSIDLGGTSEGIVGYRAKRHTAVIDVDKRDLYDALDFWEPIPRHWSTGAGSRSRPVLHPGVARGGPRAARLCRRDGAVRSAGRRVPRPLCRLLRSRLRPQARPAAPAAARCWKSGATRCRSSSSTARSSAGWSMSRMTERPAKLYGTDMASNYQAQGLKLSKHFRTRLAAADGSLPAA